MFDWEDLRHFAALARTGSLSAAARALGVDHVTVSRRVAALESSLAVKLVDRRARSYVLTRDGERVAVLASPVEEATYAVERAARAAASGVTGEVSVSAPPSIAALVIAPGLRQLRDLHPGIRVRLLGDRRDASLARREADVAVRLSRPKEGALAARRVGRFAIGLYAAASYLEGREPEALEFIAYDEDGDDLPQQRWLLSLVGPREVALRANDLGGQQEAARAGVGVAALPDFMGGNDPLLRNVPFQGPAIKREIWLVVHEDLRRSPPVRAMVEFLAGCLGRLC